MQTKRLQALQTHDRPMGFALSFPVHLAVLLPPTSRWAAISATAKPISMVPFRHFERRRESPLGRSQLITKPNPLVGIAGNTFSTQPLNYKLLFHPKIC